MAIPLNHYVYSSMGGYRTLYASRSMPKGLVEALEQLAVQVYRQAHKREVFACFRPDEQTACLVRAFQNGTDHAGRTRRCVHGIVFSLGDAAGNWFFSPLQIPDDVFLPPEASLQALQNELRFEHALQPFKPAPPKASLPAECLLWLLEAMAGGEKAVVFDERGDALDVVRSLVWVLPPGVRKAFTVSAGVPMPDVPRLGGIHLSILPASARDEGIVSAAAAAIEFPSGEAIKATQPNPYADFVASNIHSEVGFERVKKLAALLERNPPSLGPRVEWTEERFEQLLDAFDKIEQDVEEFGTVNVRRDETASLSAAKELAAAGMHRLALDVLMAVSSLAIDQYGFDGASYQETIARLRSGLGVGAAESEDPVIDHDKLVQAISYLADTLQKLLTAAQPRRNEA